MRKLLLAVLFVLLLPVLCFAAPFLICDPYTTAMLQPDSFILTFDGQGSIISPAKTRSQVPASVAALMAEGDVILCFDLGTIAFSWGSHTVYAVATKSGYGNSAPSSTLNLKTGSPIKPVGDVQ